MDRRSFFRGAAGVAAAAGWVSLSGGPASAAHAPTPVIPYSPDSFFRSRLTGAPIDAALTSRFRTFMSTFPDQVRSKLPGAPILRGVGGNAWGTAYAEGRPGDPVWRFIPGSNVLRAPDLMSPGFACSDTVAAVITGTSDSPLLILDYVGRQSILATKVSVADRAARTLRMRSGVAGRFRWDTNGLDYRNPRSNGPSNAGSRGRIPDALAIRRDLVSYGIAHGTSLGHVLHFFNVETDSSAGVVHPMTGYESGKSGFGAEGLRFAIRPDLDLTTRGLSPAALVIARTLQEYGCINGDNAGSGAGLKLAIDGLPWTGLSDTALAPIGWADWVVIQAGWPG